MPHAYYLRYSSLQGLLAFVRDINILLYVALLAIPNSLFRDLASDALPSTQGPVLLPLQSSFLTGEPYEISISRVLFLSCLFHCIKTVRMFLHNRYHFLVPERIVRPDTLTH